MRIDVFTIFPDLIEAFFDTGLIGKARAVGSLDLRAHNLRDWAGGVHQAVDDSPFGGGAGMVLSPDPVFQAVEAVEPPRPLYVLSAAGRPLDQQLVVELARGEGLSLICGRYEGVDQRVADHLADGEISVGDAVLAGGEVPAMAVVEAVTRLVPGVMGNAASGEEESFRAGFVEHPQFTRPADFRGWTVPEVLLSGDHARVARWRRAQSIARTLERRPDLIAARGGLSEEEQRLLSELEAGNLG
ncbi:MAG: tRNA (guanosine(37)-N1)-methyltransferase TrmD [Actinobacteria bacterium]|nr:tRNA (guanosine(37)-N1)-methyltransferase TrmD [Actinomycetota bacterium]